MTPFVFGRGGEEALALRRACGNVPFEIVPGISSAVAAPAYAGIPVTHRHVAASFAVVTGHEDPYKPHPTVRWDKLATSVDTLLILMGIKNCERIVSELILHGRDAATPAAVIHYGTTQTQHTLSASLADLPSAIRRADIKPPATLIIVEVVRLRDELRWFLEDADVQAQRSAGFRLEVAR